MKATKYRRDKPKDCKYCFYWNKDLKVCVRGKEHCYYLRKKKMKKPQGTCTNCPYGRVYPCVSFCMKSVINV